MFVGKLTVPLSMSGPCSIRISSETPTFVPNSRRRTRVPCGAGCLTRTFLRSQRRLLNCDLPSRFVPGLGVTKKLGNFRGLVKIAQRT